MKNRKIVAILACIFANLIVTVHAQPFHHGALGGGPARTIRCDTAGISEGTSGTNVNWTINPIPHDTAQFNQNTVAPASTPYAAHFPTATDAVGSQGALTEFTYYRIAGDSLVLLGIADSLQTIVYSDPQLVALSSLTFGHSFTDSYGYRDTTTISTASLVSKIDGTKTVTFDAAGMLMLPWKTFGHAMRFKTASSQTDSSWFGTILTSVVTTNTTSFSWEDTTLPRGTNFSITRTTTGSSVTTITSTVVNYSEPLPTAAAARLGRPGPAVSVSALPFDDGIAFRVGLGVRGDGIIVSLFDASGRTVTAARIGPTGGILATHLTKGIYLYSLKVDNELFGSGKILVK